MLHPHSAYDMVRGHRQNTPIPVVADANVLIKDVCANLRRQRPTALLGLLCAGRIRVLITNRVAHEVPTRMPRVAGQRLALAVRLWETQYLSRLRVVSVDGVDAEPEFVHLLEGVRADDPDDVATAHLALLCAPCAVISEDRDLLDHGFGAPEWVSALRASGMLGDLDLGLFYGANLTGAMIEGAAIGLFKAGKRVAASPLAIGLALGLVVFALTDGRPATAAQIQRVKPSLGRAFEVIQNLSVGLTEHRAALLADLGPCTLAQAETPPLEALLSAPLATAAEPLSIAELSRRCSREESEVRAVLRRHPAFTMVRGRGWQLGVTGSAHVSGTNALSARIARDRR